jgi:hypothetical protein
MFIYFLMLAAADPAPPTNTDQPHAVAKKDKEDRICKSEIVLGSLMPKKVCRPNWQRDAESRAAEKMLESIQTPERPQ